MRTPDFQHYREQIFGLYNARQYQAALEVALEARKNVPERPAKTAYWIACLQSRLGQFEKSLQTLNHALRSGIWWPEEALLREPDLEPLRDSPEFNAIVSESQKLKQKAELTTRPDVTVLTPINYSCGEKPPLLIGLNQRTGYPSEVVEQWASVRNNGFLLAVPQSSQPISSEEYCWDDPERSERDVQWAYKQVSAKYVFDASRVILAGFSQGAALAIYLSLNKTIPSRGFVAVAPSDWVAPEPLPASQRTGPSKGFAAFLESKAVRGAKGYVIIGSKDAFLPHIKTLFAEMIMRGLDYKLDVVQNLGHEFPTDFDRHFDLATQFLLE